MKNKLRNILLSLAIFAIFLLGGCDKPTIYKEKTIVVSIDSEIIPDISASFGEGSLDKSSMVYTHTIPYIKDVYITFSFSEYKTETLFVESSEMTADVIEKSISFGNELISTIEISVLGVTKLDTLEIKAPSEYSNLKINKNKFSLRLPSRDESEIIFSLEGYKEFRLEFTEEDLVSGYKTIEVPALKDGEMYIDIFGAQFNYRIFSATTDVVCASGFVWNTKPQSNYVILPDNENYYAEISSSSSYIIRDIDASSNNKINFNAISKYYGTTGYLNVNLNFEYHNYMVYYKNQNILGGTNMIAPIEQVGILYLDKDGNAYYCDDISDRVLSDNSNWQHEVYLNESHFTPVELDITVFDLLTNEELDPSLVWNYSQISAVYSDGKFTMTKTVMREAPLFYELVDKDGNLLYTYEGNYCLDDWNLVYPDHHSYIYTNFDGMLVSGIFGNKQRNCFYQDSITLDELEYNGSFYTCDPIVVNTDTFLSTLLIQRENGFEYLHSYYNPVLIDDELNLVPVFEAMGSAYFELEANVEYTLKFDDETFIFTPSEKEILTGTVFVGEKEIDYVSIKLPEKAYVQYSGNLCYYPDEEGIAYVPRFEDNFSLVAHQNDYMVPFNVYSDQTEITVSPIYAFKDMYFYEDETIKIVNSQPDYNYYVFINKDDTTPLQTNLKELKNSSSYDVDDRLIITLNDLVYDEELGMYAYDLEKQYDYVITCSNTDVYNVKFSDAIVNMDSYEKKIFVNEGTTLSFYGNTITISGYESKHLYLEMSGINMYIHEQD